MSLSRSRRRPEALRSAAPERGLDLVVVWPSRNEPAPDLAGPQPQGAVGAPRRRRGRPTARAGLRECRAGRRRAGTPGGPPARGSGARRSRSRPSRAARWRAGGGGPPTSRRTPLRRGCVRALSGKVERQRDHRRIEEGHARLDRGLHRVLVLAVEQVGEIGGELAAAAPPPARPGPGRCSVGAPGALAHRLRVGGRRRRGRCRQERRLGGCCRARGAAARATARGRRAGAARRHARRTSSTRWRRRAEAGSTARYSAWRKP